MHFRHLNWNLTKKEIDLVNVLINIVEMYDKLDIGHTFDYNSPVYMLDLTYHDLASLLEYSTLDYKIIQEINTILDNLSKVQATVHFSTDEDEDRYVENNTFILKYILSSTKKNTRRDLNKRFTLMLDTSLIKVLRENKDLFKKLYTHDRYDLRSKYSTILYDELAHKAKESSVIAFSYTIDEFVTLVDFELEETSNTESWTKINSNILKRASKEINEKTNMYFDYSKVKEKITETNRTQTNGIRFEVSLAPESEETPEYFDEEMLMDRKVSYYIEKELNRKISELKKFNDSKVQNEDNYRYMERQRLNKSRKEFEAKVKIQEFVNWIKYNKPGDHGLVCFFDYDGCDYVTVNSEHKLMDIESGKILSKNAKETYTKLQEFVNNDGDYDLVDVDNKPEYSISYSKG